MNNVMANIKIPLPPLDIQQQIVSECEAIDGEVEKAELAFVAAKNKIENIASNLNTYKMDKLENVCLNWDSKRKPVTRSDRTEGEYPYYGASGIVDYVSDFLIDDCVLLVSEDGANLKSRVTPIAFTAIGKIWVNNHAHILKFENKNMQRLTEVYLNHLDLEEFITGMAQPKLSQNNLNRIKIPVPDLETQQTLVTQIEIIEMQIDDAQKVIDGAASRKAAVLSKFL
jgi:restriction endonuclease S subunit